PGGSSGVSGYRVYRRLANGKWPATPLATTAAATLTYTDSGLANGTAYAYRVTTLAGTRESKPSAIASATPRAGDAGGPCGRTSTPPAQYDHVVWVIMENKAYSSIIGSASA